MAGTTETMGRSTSTLALFAVFAATALGIILAFSIPNSVFPEIQFNRAVILVDSGDLPAQQMLVAVTRPLEQAAYGVLGTTLVRSTTTRGSAEIDVNFSEKANATASYQLLNAALSNAKASLPPGTKINTRLLTNATYEILNVSMSSPIRDLAGLTDIAFYHIIPDFHRITGVYRVEMSGDKYREYVVRLDPAEMLAHKLSPQDVIAGLAKANVVASAGRVIDKHRMLLTVVTTNLHTAEQLDALPIATMGGQPIYVRNIGTVQMGIREDYVRVESQNGPAVLIGVTEQSGANTVAISKAVHAQVQQLRAEYPDVNFSFNYDQAALVTESFNSVRDAIVLGLILSVAVVFVFTLSLVNALIAAIVVPCTIAITFIVMKAAGMTFNMMTLGGLAAGIGLFIDDAIVMIEAIHRSRALKVSSSEALSRALNELRRPLIASTFTVIVAFLPLAFLTGVSGVFFRALAITLGAGLFISLILALFFTPALETVFERIRGRSRTSGRVFGLIINGYVLSLKPFVRLPVASLIFAAICFAIAFGFYKTIGTDYLPAMDEGAFVLDYITPPQSTLHDTGVLLHKIQAILKATPEVVAFARRTGTQRGFQLSESNIGDITVRLKANRSRGIDAIMNSVRQRVLAAVPGVHVEFSQVLQDLIGDLSGTPQPIEVKVFGADQDTIRSTANRVAEILHRTPGLVDVFNGIVLSSPEQEIRVNETAAERYGLTAQAVQAALRAVVQGTVATQLRVGDRLYGVRVRYPASYHENLSKLSQVLLLTPSNGAVPLSTVTTLRWLGEQPELDRERLRPVVHVTARLQGVNLGEAMARVIKRVGAMEIPAGVTLEYGGLYAVQQKAFGQLEMVLIAGIVLMFLVVLWEFHRLAPAVAVMIGALACLCGSFIGLWVIGITLNISSFMGIIMVVGIAAKNGILLLDHAEHYISGGEPARDGLLDAARIRIRPIMMTTLATAAGLLPLALGIGAGAKVQQPLAVAVIGGLIFALLFSTPLAGGVYLIGARRRPASSAD
ncbi:MAG: efflux RND transporter permease subunit [Candidatus Binataceae bacterium]